MDSKVTFFGIKTGPIARQMAVLTTAFILLQAAELAYAGPYPSQSSNSSSDQLLIIQGNGSMQPAVNPHPGTYGTISGGISQGVFGPAVQLWPSSISYSRVVDSPKPVLQTDLHLGIEYTYQFNFVMRARAADSGMPNVPDGWYELDVAVVKPQIKTSYLNASVGVKTLSAYERFVTSASMLVQVSGGMTNRQITLRYPNLSATTIANHLYVSLTPLEKNCVTSPGSSIKAPCVQVDGNGQPNLKASTIRPLAGFQPYMLDIPFVPYVPGGSGTSNPDDAPVSPNPTINKNLPTYIAMARAYQAKQGTNRPSEVMQPLDFALSKRLNMLTPRDAFFQSSNQQWAIHDNWQAAMGEIFKQDSVGMVRATKNIRSLWPTICAALVTKNQKLVNDFASNHPTFYIYENVYDLIRMCGDNPEMFFRASMVDHIYAFDANNVTVDAMLPQRFNLSTNFILSRSKSTDTSTSFSPMELIFKPFDVFGIPLRAIGISRSMTVSNGRSEGESSSGSVSTSIDFNMMPVTIPVINSQRCLEIKPLPVKSWPFYDDTAKLTRNGLYICQPVSTRVHPMGEVYSHIFAHNGDTSLVDSYSPLAQSVNFALRGDRDVTTFFAITRQSLTADHGSQIFPPDMLKTATSYLLNTPSSEAGVIVRPVHFEGDTTPSFFAKAFGTSSENFVTPNN